MRLAVLGSAPIHVMTSWITAYFSDVPVSYPGTAPAAPLPSSPADSVAANFDRDWFKMCACVPRMRHEPPHLQRPHPLL